jgi:hypothetical protein
MEDLGKEKQKKKKPEDAELTHLLQDEVEMDSLTDEPDERKDLQRIQRMYTVADERRISMCPFCVSAPQSASMSEYNNELSILIRVLPYDTKRTSSNGTIKGICSVQHINSNDFDGKCIEWKNNLDIQEADIDLTEERIIFKGYAHVNCMAVVRPVFTDIFMFDDELSSITDSHKKAWPVIQCSHCNKETKDGDRICFHLSLGHGYISVGEASGQNIQPIAVHYTCAMNYFPPTANISRDLSREITDQLGPTLTAALKEIKELQRRAEITTWTWFRVYFAFSLVLSVVLLFTGSVTHTVAMMVFIFLFYVIFVSSPAHGYRRMCVSETAQIERFFNLLKINIEEYGRP